MKLPNDLKKIIDRMLHEITFRNVIKEIEYNTTLYCEVCSIYDTDIHYYIYIEDDSEYGDHKLLCKKCYEVHKDCYSIVSDIENNHMITMDYYNNLELIDIRY